ncbi:N-acetylmuramoyl-L-alanine amidase [Orrella sp. NBD-18]|uniref:N-acetylmuramoyl-L-alanine amidase n=2 Tax=Sheuella amnicola TaxID=2707330 RepID=A0A6B2QYQ1_9BURK|nr:N-acetylmuramoyl-L-alanine amidase [Sheuella amnicola]NDY83122.1 N-acetylmuramoyl-L-alanine amidase [Sheuella amnicola]HBI84484.1 N-acetylmuramoyl-L-alanine amidase [Alcaligenaceae bacterium]
MILIQLRRFAFFLILAILAGCASRGPYELNDSMKSTGQNSRVEMIVLHYTASSKPTALMVLTNRDVSAHYLVTDDNPPVVYRLVDETRNAWHAGESSWYGRTYLNQRSIGIEIVHPGWERNNSGNMGAPYPANQINAVIALTKEIAKRHDIRPENIVGHSDVAPLRKQDPGPSFPWKQLAQAGLGRWYDESAATKYEADFNKKGLPDAKWWQGQLKRVGYQITETGIMDANTRHVIAAFQMHYRPDAVTGKPDAQTAGRLLALPTTGTSLR